MPVVVNKTGRREHHHHQRGPTGNVTTRSPGVGLPKLQAPTTESLQANRIGTTAPVFKEETEAQRGSAISPRSYSYQMAAGHSYTVLPKKDQNKGSNLQNPKIQQIQTPVSDIKCLHMCLKTIKGKCGTGLLNGSDIYAVCCITWGCKEGRILLWSTTTDTLKCSYTYIF